MCVLIIITDDCTAGDEKVSDTKEESADSIVIKRGKVLKISYTCTCVEIIVIVYFDSNIVEGCR